MLDIGSLELADVVDVTISDLWRCICPVLVQNALRIPILNLADQSNNTTSSML